MNLSLRQTIEWLVKKIAASIALSSSPATDQNQRLADKLKEDLSPVCTGHLPDPDFLCALDGSCCT